MKLWLKAPDSNRQCCGCEGKISPCDSCCPIISGIPPDLPAFPLQKNWDVYTNGFFKDKLLKYCYTGNTSTEQINPIPTIPGSFVFTANGTNLATISSNSDNCQIPDTFGYTSRVVPYLNFSPPAAHPPDLLQLESRNAEFQFELTINTGEYIKIATVLQSPNVNVLYYDPHFFVMAGAGSSNNSQTGTRYVRLLQANSSITLQTDYKWTRSGEGLLKEYYTFDITAVESGGILDIGYSNFTSYLDETCQIVFIKPASNTFYQSALSATNSSIDGNTVGAQSFSARSSSVVQEVIFVDYQQTPICPDTPPAQFLGLPIQNIGLETYGKYKISNIKKIVSPQNYFTSPAPQQTETPVGSACINVISNNQGAIQIFDKQNVSIPISGRLRQFKFPALP